MAVRWRVNGWRKEQDQLKNVRGEVTTRTRDSALAYTKAVKKYPGCSELSVTEARPSRAEEVVDAIQEFKGVDTNADD